MVHHLGSHLDLLVSCVAIHRLDVVHALLQQLLAEAAPGKKMVLRNFDM